MADSGHREDVLVSRFGAGGVGEASADLDPPGVEPLQTQVQELVSQGRCPVAHYCGHGHPLAPLQGPGLGQGPWSKSSLLLKISKILHLKAR